MRISRFTNGCVAGSFLWTLPALVLCQDSATRSLVRSLGSEEYKDREKAQRELVEWARSRPDRAEEWLLREYDAAVEPEIRLRLRAALEELVIGEHQKNGKGYVGIQMGEVEVTVPGDKALRTGVRISWVAEETPASRAGLRAGDVIVALDQLRWSQPGAVESFAEAVKKCKPGTTVDLEILRDGELKRFPTTLAARPMGLPERQNFNFPNAMEPQPDFKTLEKEAKDQFFEQWLAEKRASVGER